MPLGTVSRYQTDSARTPAPSLVSQRNAGLSAPARPPPVVSSLLQRTTRVFPQSQLVPVTITAGIGPGLGITGLS